MVRLVRGVNRAGVGRVCESLWCVWWPGELLGRAA